jgi:hypothetical protein
MDDCNDSARQARIAPITAEIIAFFGLALFRRFTDGQTEGTKGMRVRF